MEYFRLETDKQWHGHIQIMNLQQSIDKRKIHLTMEKKIKDGLFFRIASEEERYPDVLDRDLFLISEQMKSVFSMYQSGIVFKNVSLVNLKNGHMLSYNMPLLQEVDCLSSESELNLDRSVIKKMVLMESKIGDHRIFRLKHGDSQIVIVRLDVAESILRRNFYGVSLRRIELEKINYGT